MLNEECRRVLLEIARAAIRAAINGKNPSQPDLTGLPLEMRAKGASFVTLTRDGDLRGCIGSLEARVPLAEDVSDHAVDAALNDYRFPPLTAPEEPLIHIEVSVLTAPVRLEYSSPAELPGKLQPGTDGVILAHGMRRATYLPQVWEQIPDPKAFLASLCEKMGADAGLWRREKLDVYTYAVEHFEEPQPKV